MEPKYVKKYIIRQISEDGLVKPIKDSWDRERYHLPYDTEEEAFADCIKYDLSEVVIMPYIDKCFF